MTLSDRMKLARREAGLSQKQTAERAGVDQTTISNLERGKHAGSSHLVTIARALGVDPRWLATGEGAMEPLEIGSALRAGRRSMGLMVRDSAGEENTYTTSNVEPAPPVRGMAPEISWVAAGAWAEVCHVETDPDATTWHPRIAGGEHTFVLRVVGDSMLPDFPPGRLIFVDPDRSPENGDDVIAVLTDTDEATFKRYIEEPGSGRMLKALNPAWRDPYLPINGNCRIIGVVVADMRLR